MSPRIACTFPPRDFVLKFGSRRPASYPAVQLSTSHSRIHPRIPQRTVPASCPHEAAAVGPPLPLLSHDTLSMRKAVAASFAAPTILLPFAAHTRFLVRWLTPRASPHADLGWRFSSARGPPVLASATCRANKWTPRPGSKEVQGKLVDFFERIQMGYLRSDAQDASFSFQGFFLDLLPLSRRTIVKTKKRERCV